LCSIYRLPDSGLDDALRPEHGGEPYELEVAGRPALRVDRISDDHHPDWAVALEAMTGRPFAYLTRAAGAVLLVDLGDVRYALTFGTGRHLLRDPAVQRDFGLAVAIRCLHPERVAEITRTALDVTSRHDLTFVPAGTHVRTFGIEQYAEIVKEIGGRSENLELAHLRGRPGGVKLEGRDALRVRVSDDPAVLIGDLIAIEKMYQQDAHPELAFIEGLRPITARDGRLARAHRALRDELAKANGDRLGLAIPLGLDDVAITSFTVYAAGREATASEPDLEVVRALLADVPEADRIDAFRDGKVLLEVDGIDEPVETPLGAWLAADLTVGRDQYVVHEGDFYLMSGRYREALFSEIDTLLRKAPGWTMPVWRPGQPEGTYCQQVGKLDDFVCLDKKLVRGGAHPRGVEICDLLGPSGELICVKRAHRSSALSHLFSQAIVAAENLCDGDQAYQKLLAMLPESRRADVPRRPEFIFAIQLTKGDLTADSLFTFSQVGLFRAARHLHRLNMKVCVVGIDAR